MRISPIKQLGYEPDPILARKQMSDLVQALNRFRIPTRVVKPPTEPRTVRLALSDMQTELRRLITVWIKSGPNLRKMFRKDSALAQRAQIGKTVFYPSAGARGYLDWSPVLADQTALSPHDQAFEYFMTLVTNPQWELLGGPCARCGDYYLKKTKRQKAYCSRACGATATAIPAMKRRRQKEHANKIRQAQGVIEEWGKAKRSRAWKEWVSVRTGYTAKWITRAVNNGSLRLPHRRN
jgi:hypothetical protein